MPLYTADALVLRTYKLAEADRIVVFLTRDRGKKRGVAPHARRPRSRFTGALEPLTEVRVAYFEKERRELVNLNYAETGALAAVGGQPREPCVQPLFCRADRCVGGRRRRRRAAVPAWAARCSTRWRRARPAMRWRAISNAGCCGCRACIPSDLSLSRGALAFIDATRQVTPAAPDASAPRRRVLRELERKHQALITSHLEKELKSIRVMNELRRLPEQ